MKSPDQCSDIQDIRVEIDRLDRQIIGLLGERFAYVKAAAQFKSSLANVQAADRFRAMLQVRRQWAEAVGLSADAIEKMYRDLVTHFIQEETAAWQQSQAQAGEGATSIELGEKQHHDEGNRT